jgi:hypothetical protein
MGRAERCSWFRRDSSGKAPGHMLDPTEAPDPDRKTVERSVLSESDISGEQKALDPRTIKASR